MPIALSRFKNVGFRYLQERATKLGRGKLWERRI